MRMDLVDLSARLMVHYNLSFFFWRKSLELVALNCLILTDKVLNEQPKKKLNTDIYEIGCDPICLLTNETKINNTSYSRRRAPREKIVLNGVKMQLKWELELA